jgi:beta-glucosidase/6-phospho-beta-glucosidase/beta-galactosidase
MSGEREGLPDAVKYWKSVIDECNKRGFKKILVEQHFKIPLSMMEAFNLVEELSRMKVAGIKLAFVDRDSTQNDVNIFAETVGLNRGLIGKIFTNTDDAEKYLRA